jgi:hypothetical protein
MFEIVILVVLIALAAVAGLALLMFLDVGFAESIRGRTSSESKQAGLPLLGGEELRRWAKGVAERIVSKHASQPRGRDSVLGMAAEVLDGTSQVISEVASTTHRPRSRATSCSARCHEMIGVTAPEALAIVEELESVLSKRSIDAIRERARCNARQAVGLNHDQFPAANLTCPLYTESGRCATFASRPLYCRGACAECAPGECRRESHEVPPSQAFATTVGDGMLAGLKTGLESAGLDGQIYELNSALSAALSTPDAAGRFARGEPVFTGCHPYS